MINFYFADLAKLMLAVIVSFFPSSAKAPLADAALFRVGNAINDMVLTSSALGTIPFWLDCPSTVNQSATPTNCLVPQVQDAWDIVLTNLQPAVDTIKGQVGSDTKEYKSLVNLFAEKAVASNPSPKVHFKSCGFLGHSQSISPYC